MATTKIESAVNGILKPSDAHVRCHAIVDLISKVQRPYLFRVTVWGEPPHAYRRTYDIAGWNEDAAARKGLDVFTKEMENPLIAFLQTAPLRKN